MKAILRCKEFDQLKPSEQKRLIDIMNKEATKMVNDEVEKWFCDYQEIWLKLNVMSMNRKGLSRNTIICVLGNWRMLYRMNHRKIKNNEQQEWLDTEMDAILGDRKIINDYIETLKKI